MTAWRRMLVMIAAMLAAFASYGANDKDKLKKVDSQIRQTRAVLAKQKAERDAVQTRLQKLDQAIGQLARQLNDLSQQRQQQQQQRQQLQTQISQLQDKARQQQQMLARELRAAYATGHDDFVKMLLNLQSAGDMERMLGYYQILSNKRLQALKEIKATRAELSSSQQQLNSTLAQLAQLQQQAQERQQRLNDQKAERQKAVDELNQQIKSRSGKLEQLLADRQALDNLIKEAQRRAKLAKGQSTLKGQQGKLQWPARGHVQRLFGRHRAAGIAWKGVIIDASEGAKVHAIAGGTVVYADWVRGFGLLVAIQHGDGYLSLYGQNQALLKKVGDKVHQGEAIALVGRSGGQSEPGLYFEIRHRGRAVNPSKWCR